jgi:hypothetical protein
MYIRVKLISNTQNVGSLKDSYINVQKHSGHTIKKDSVMLDQETGKMTYGSHNGSKKKCIICSGHNYKKMESRRKNFKDSMKSIINDYSED